MKKWLLTVTLMIAAVAGARTWTDVNGRSMEAEFVSTDVRQGKVTLRRVNSEKTVIVELQDLAEADREFAVKQWIEKFEVFAVDGTVEWLIPGGAPMKYSEGGKLELFIYDLLRDRPLAKCGEAEFIYAFDKEKSLMTARFSAKDVPLDKRSALLIRAHMTASFDKNPEKTFVKDKIIRSIRPDDEGNVSLATMKNRLNRSDFKTAKTDEN